MSDIIKKPEGITIGGEPGKRKIGAPKIGIHAKIAANSQKDIYRISEKQHKIAIILDDSGSMQEHVSLGKTSDSRVNVTRMASKAFLEACSPADTALSIKSLNNSIDKDLTVLYVDLEDAIDQKYHTCGGTDLYTVTEKVLNGENKLTRIIVMSDGEPGDSANEGYFAQFTQRKVPVDTVYIGDPNEERGIKVLREIADKTGGIFIQFKDAESFRKNFKYLAPAYRGLLMAPGFKETIQG